MAESGVTMEGKSDRYCKNSRAPRLIFYIVYIFLQWTWGFLQTFAGFIVLMINIRRPHHFYRGCIETVWKKEYYGMSLGMFIFVDSRPDASRVRVHEYGHTLQSMVLGPFFPFVALISGAWANLPFFIKRRRKKNIPYTSCFVESNASRLGEKYTGEKATWH